MQKNPAWVNLRKVFQSREFGLFVVLVLLCTAVQIRNNAFLTASVINGIFKNYSYTMTMAVGMMLVLLIGGIDISVGSVLALSGMTSALLMRDGIIFHWIPAYLVSIMVGCLCGAIIGLVIAKGRIQPIIATLGFQYIYRGLTYVISDSKTVTSADMAPAFKAFGQGTTFGIDNLVLITLIIYVLFFFLMRWTKAGRRVYCVGSNTDAARITGIHVDVVQILVYTVSSGIAGLCGAMYVSYYATSQNQQAMGIEMDVIAACVIGGVSLEGGEGSVIGVFLGAVTIAVISKSLSLVGIDPFWQSALKGATILLAVIINVLTQRNMHRRMLATREV